VGLGFIELISFVEEFLSMADQWYKFAKGFILVFSFSDKNSFLALENMHNDILRVKDRKYVPCLMISNKVRLPQICSIPHHPSFLAELDKVVLSHAFG
jgi:hypothetical protein